MRDRKEHELPQITEAEDYDHCLVSIFYYAERMKATIRKKTQPWAALVLALQDTSHALSLFTCTWGRAEIRKPFLNIL